MMQTPLPWRVIWTCGLLLATLGTSGCPGPDYMPVYFPTAESSDGSATPPSTNAPEGPKICTVQLHATLCVMIKGEKIEVGTKEKGDFCVEDLPPIPIEINNTNVTLRGDLFPDIIIEGHGLPVPITINGKGNTDGKGNTGTGTVDPAGQMSIDHFSLFISALDKVGEIPALSLTTGSIGPIGNLPALSGKPLDAGGKIDLVAGTKLGPLFPGADELLLGAAMMARFSGTITPPLRECTGTNRPTQFEVVKLVLDVQGKETSVPIPNGDQLEVSTGTFIAIDPTDIGPRFEAIAKFRITNIHKDPVVIQIPPAVGPFTLQSPGVLNQTLAPKATLLIHVTFRPQHATVKQAGQVLFPLTLGKDTFYLSAVALDPTGRTAIDLLNPTGVVTRENVANIALGEIAVPATQQRAYFQCDPQMCGGAPLPSHCQPCLDVTLGRCQLLTVGAGGHPMDEVAADCQPAYPHEKESTFISFSGDGTNTFLPASQLIAIRNMGPQPLTITALLLKELTNTKSTGQFHFLPAALFVGDSFQAVAAQLQAATTAALPHVTGLPITLPPYEPPLVTTRAFAVIGYAPTDLIGTDGRVAGVGTSVTDQTELIVLAGDVATTIRVKGTTTIKDVPPLQVFFKTATGLKDRIEGQSFAFRGITGDTTDLAVPIFIRATEGTTHSIRVVGIGLSGPDVAAFEWLDASEEILAKPEAVRCTIPILDPISGGQTGTITTLKPTPLGPNGFDLKPGAYSTDTMPLFGCVNFHRDATVGNAKQRQFEALLTITAQQLGADRQPLKNPDGTVKQSQFRIPLVAVINPRAGKMVLRLTQTMSAMLNPKFPGLASVASKHEVDSLIAAGQAKPSDFFIYLGGIILDPFDEETIANEHGDVLTKPGDGVTAIFRAVDTHPTTIDYADPILPDYANLGFDAGLPAGQRGIFFDYPNLPANLQTGSLRIYTATLSWPGPTARPEERPDQPSTCQVVDPCSAAGQRMFAEGPSEPGKKGVCAYFFTSAGNYQSPAFHTAAEMEGGARKDLCQAPNQPQEILDWRGEYTLDGSLSFEDGGLQFWGPTYFHNPHGFLAHVPPLHEVYHLTFTTETLLPPAETPGHNFIPESRLNFSKQEHKLNLNDPNLETPAVCPNNTDNQILRGKSYSSWRYMAPFLYKDPKGEIHAGCPEEGSSFTGGSAFVRGRRLDHATGIMTVVAATKFSANDDLTFAFKDVNVFIVLNGWLCDPQGNPAEFEGERCYERTLNERDARSQISVMEGQP